MQIDKELKKFGSSPFYKHNTWHLTNKTKEGYLTLKKKKKSLSLLAKNQAVFDHKAILQAHL